MDPSRAALSLRINHMHINQPGKSVNVDVLRQMEKIWKICVWVMLLFYDGVIT